MWDWSEFFTGFAVMLIGLALGYAAYRAHNVWKFRGIANLSGKDDNQTVEMKRNKDLLDRCALSEDYLKSIITMNNSDIELSRFAIEGGYGFGKSFLIDYMQTFISEKHEGEYIALNFKAWERDEFYSPTSRLLIQIVGAAEELELNKGEIRLLKKMIQHDKDKGDIPYSQYTKKYDFLHNTLGSIFRTGGKKLFIFIDELDRAAPEDVIEFLEVTNHFFKDNENIILIYGYDRKNIKSIIKSHIGIEDNSYLTKFVDFTFKLDNQSIDYLHTKLSQDDDIRFIGNYIQNTKLNAVMSLRDVDNWIYLAKYYKTRFEHQLLWKVCVVLDINNRLGELTEKSESTIINSVTRGLLSEYLGIKGADALIELSDEDEAKIRFDIWGAGLIDNNLKTLLGGSKDNIWGFEKILQVAHNKKVPCDVKIDIKNKSLEVYKSANAYKVPNDFADFVRVYHHKEQLKLVANSTLKINGLNADISSKHFLEAEDAIKKDINRIRFEILEKNHNEWTGFREYAPKNRALNRRLNSLKGSDIYPEYIQDMIDISTNW